MKLSKEYTVAGALLLGVILKQFGVEIPNADLESIIMGVGLLAIAIFRYRKGDISPLGVKS